jgi:hypothetical protein
MAIKGSCHCGATRFELSDAGSADFERGAKESAQNE